MKEIPLTQGKVALVDDADYPWLMAMGKWCAANLNGWWYAVRSERRDDDKQYTVYMHRLIMGSPQEKVDHWCGETLNNQRYNLRLATNAQNTQNQKLRINNTSGFKGVSFSRACRKWKARITANRRITHIGFFPTRIEAALAYNAKALELFGEFARLNIISGES